MLTGSLLLVAMTGSSSSDQDVSASHAGVQRALKALERSDFAEAETQALAAATHPTDPDPQAWLIVASARKSQKQHAGAIRAYRLFLASAADNNHRQFVLKQIAACQQEQNPPRPVKAPGKRLTPKQLKELSEVDKGTLFSESSEHFIVRARNDQVAKLVAAEAENALNRICNAILAGQEYGHSVDIFVWADRDEYRKHATDAPEWAGGNYSITRKHGVLTRRIDLTQLDANGNFAVKMLDRILPHELCHLVVDEFFGDAPSPLFLNEGLAMLAEAEPDNDRIAVAGTALAGDGKMPLDQLLISERYNVKSPAVFYAESYSFTEYIHSRLNPEQFRSFLLHLKEGNTVVQALQRAMYLADDGKFQTRLAAAWEEHAITQAQLIRALRGERVMLGK